MRCSISAPLALVAVVFGVVTVHAAPPTKPPHAPAKQHDDAKGDSKSDPKTASHAKGPGRKDDAKVPKDATDDAKAAHGAKPEEKSAHTASAPEDHDRKDAKVSPVSPSEHHADAPITITTKDGQTLTCRPQGAQPFLIRGNWFPHTKDADEVKKGRDLLTQSIRYRTEKYGFFEGFGSAKWNAHPPRHYAKSTTFLGLPVTVHERIIPALKCVEAALKANGASSEYHPRAMGGIRFKNTYRGLEVSNHVYGIAVDIEPDRNTCCGCVAPWNSHPLCKSKKTVWERMAMPKSWVETFERFGFYWLGHDVLQDTMHFEFLGDPDAIAP